MSQGKNDQQLYHVPVNSYVSLVKMLDQHWEQTLSRGFLPKIKINDHDDSLAFVSELPDQSQFSFQIDPANGSWQTTLEVSKKPTSR